jgi:hypothetical protein
MREPVLLLLLLFAVSVGAQSKAGSYDNAQPATATCPWLTTGTAASALGGEVAATMSVTKPAEGTCRFARRDDAMEFLEIRVSAAPLAACPAGSPALHAIGNEAERCRVSASRGITEEMASGRVREIHFTVTMAGRGNRHVAEPTDSDDTLARMADEVAGNLF